LERPWEQALNFGSICKETGIYGIACASINLFLPSERLQLNMLPYDTQAFTGKTHYHSPACQMERVCVRASTASGWRIFMLGVAKCPVMTVFEFAKRSNITD